MFNFQSNKELSNLTTDNQGNAIPDNIKPFYEQVDAEDATKGYKLINSPVVNAAVAIVAGAEEAMKKERKNKPAEVDLSPLSDYGDNPEAIASAVTKKIDGLKAQIKDGGAAVKSQIEELKREMTTAHATAMQEKDSAIATLTKQLDDNLIDTEINTAASAYKGLNSALIKPFARQRMSVVADDDGNRSVVVLNHDGTTRYSMENAGELATAAELLKDMAKDDTYSQLFPSQARQGDGTPPSQRIPGNRQKTSANQDTRTAAQKISDGLGKKK